MTKEESMQTRWAALLTNTVSEGATIDTTLYTHILGQMTRSDAEVFEVIAYACTSVRKDEKITITVKEYTAVHVMQLSKGNRELLIKPQSI